MEPNRRAHRECVYASNPYHECASACLERIARGKERKETIKQAPNLHGISASFAKKKKESESQLKPRQIGSLPVTNNPAKDPLIHPFPKKSLAPEKKEYFSLEEEERSRDIYTPNDNFYVKPDRVSQPSSSASNTPNRGRAATPKASKLEITDEKNNTTDDTRNFGFLTRDHDVDGHDDGDDDDDEHDDDEDDHDDDDDEIESVISDSCVSVGKYRIKSTLSSVLKSIIDKHGDIAANCKLESASMRARYLECLCAVIQELKSTPFDHLTKVKVKEMLAVLKDLESVRIDVDWLRCVLDELVEAIEVKSRYREKEMCDRLLETMKTDLTIHEEDLARKEKEVVEAKARVDEMRERLNELETEQTRLNGIEPKVQKFKGQRFIDELL